MAIKKGGTTIKKKGYGYQKRGYIQQFFRKKYQLYYKKSIKQIK